MNIAAQPAPEVQEEQKNEESDGGSNETILSDIPEEEVFRFGNNTKY